MDQNFIGKTINFISDHYELLIYVNGSLLLFLFLVALTVKLREESVRKFLISSFRGVLYAVIVGGQIFLFMILVSLYWKNYQVPAPELTLSDEIKATTRWVKDETTIYFVREGELWSIKPNGQGKAQIFSSDEPIREYHFSPDGKYILIVTERSLHLYNFASGRSRRIDGLDREDAQPSPGSDIAGMINIVKWAPDSQRFIYEIARWSKYGSVENLFIYSLPDGTKQVIKSPTRRISSVYWGYDGRQLYYLYHEALDPSVDPSNFMVKVFKIPLDTLVPEAEMEIPYEKSTIPIDNLKFRGIELFLDRGRLSFGENGSEKHLKSPSGALIGIDEDNYLFYQNAQWFRKRLFKVPMADILSESQRYQYAKGEPVIEHFRWIPGGRYVIMEHKDWGVLILEPATGNIGVLIEASGHSFGWYQKPDA